MRARKKNVAANPIPFFPAFSYMHSWKMENLVSFGPYLSLPWPYCEVIFQVRDKWNSPPAGQDPLEECIPCIHSRRTRNVANRNDHAMRNSVCLFSRRTWNLARMRDRLSWYMVFLILPTILLARSLDKGEWDVRHSFGLEITLFFLLVQQRIVSSRSNKGSAAWIWIG
jgi:hypothetical protein